MIHYDIHRDNPQVRYLESAKEILKNRNGICIYPTDTVYGMGACVSNPKTIDRICSIIHKDKKRRLSFICSDFSQVSRYVKMSNYAFKLMKHYLPGPFTFILPATNYVPKKVCPKRKTVGIRIPDCSVCMELVKILDEPLANASLAIPIEYRGDPSYFDHTVSNEVDVCLDVGVIDDPTGSTIVDLTTDEPEVIRQGKGEWHG